MIKLRRNLQNITPKYPMAQVQVGQRGHFLDLPPELRNMIYEYLLHAASGRLRIRWDDTQRGIVLVDESHTRGQLKRRLFHSLGVGILGANKQIRGEALPMFYAGNHFTIHDPALLHMVPAMLNKTHTEHIKRLTLDVAKLGGAHAGNWPMAGCRHCGTGPHFAQKLRFSAKLRGLLSAVRQLKSLERFELICHYRPATCSEGHSGANDMADDLFPVLEFIAGRQGWSRFRSDDIQAIVKLSLRGTASSNPREQSVYRTLKRKWRATRLRELRRARASTL